MDIQNNNSVLIIPIRIEALINEIHSHLGIPYKKEHGSVYEAFENELLHVLHKRNIYTIEQVKTDHLIMVILNFMKKHGVEYAVVLKNLCIGIFRMAAELGFMPLECSPAEELDKIFAKPTTWIFNDFF